MICVSRVVLPSVLSENEIRARPAHQTLASQSAVASITFAYVALMSLTPLVATNQIPCHRRHPPARSASRPGSQRNE